MSEATLCIPAGTAIIPRTQMFSGPLWPIAVMSSFAVSTSTVGPPAPPVVPFWPQAFTEANPDGVPEVEQSPGGGGVTVGVTVGVTGGPLGPPTSVTSTSSNEALA
ncbi:hypothetical protein [Nonomuraea indica]|uniref:Uncharacterized protein n=1 Tax=Nonomuraea indica TaxID=1581193 RepID=A0ABW8A767_9ACTN